MSLQESASLPSSCSGALGEVYRARDTRLDRTVAGRREWPARAKCIVRRAIKIASRASTAPNRQCSDPLPNNSSVAGSGTGSWIV